jgi:hypothetical protein
VPNLRTDGQGTFYWRNGATWQGTFDHGQPSGNGKHYCPATGEITDVSWNSQFDCCCSCPGALERWLVMRTWVTAGHKQLVELAQIGQLVLHRGTELVSGTTAS